jgi:alpha-tubulin suppressor-like RCC1 family protein
MSKRKADVNDSISVIARSSNTPSNPADRQIVRSTISARNKRAKLDYYTEMKDLNEDFAESCRWLQNEIQYRIENGETTDDLCFEAAATLYMKAAKEIKDKYFPTKGSVLTSGSNEFGQCGFDEGIDQRYYAENVPGLVNGGVTKVVAGGQSSYALNEQGEVVSWGCHDNGCLGRILSDDQYAPLQVVGFVPSGLEVAQQSLRKHEYDFRMIRSARSTDPSAILSIDGEIYLNPQVDPSTMKHFDEAIVDLDAGDIHCIALSDTGRVYTFGALKCTEGAFIHDEFPADDFRRHPDAKQRKELSKHPIWGSAFWPNHVFQLPGQAISVAATCSSNCAIVSEMKGETVTRRLYTWGMGECGELSRPVSVKPKKEEEEIYNILVARGLDPEKDKLPSHEQYNLDIMQKEYMVPQPVEFADGINDREIIKVTCGSYHILVLAKGEDDKVAVFASGLNNYGQLGLGHTDNVEKLTEVSYYCTCRTTGRHRTIFFSLQSCFTFARSHGFQSVILKSLNLLLESIILFLSMLQEKTFTLSVVHVVPNLVMLSHVPNQVLMSCILFLRHSLIPTRKL